MLIVLKRKIFYNFCLITPLERIDILSKLFERIPADLFSPLSRKYRSVYAFALLCLYRCLKTYKTDIKKVDYINMIKNQGVDLMSLFNVDMDKLDDKEEEDQVEIKEDGDVLNNKVNYIVRKLANCGWFIISKDSNTNIEYIYIPAYSIQFLKVIDDLTSDIGSYLPLVHQTYAELKMEDDKEDDYMYRALLNARNNADSIEMSVTLLRQQICVFGNRLTSVLDPNIALKQHFDDYRVNVSDKYYHPMKTFDSLGLYSQPTISILRKWLKSERIIALLVKEAKSEPMNRNRDEAQLTKEMIKIINEIIDIFSRLTASFNEIDKANANYTEQVQKKINYLSSTDKTVKGKIDRIILALANEIKNNPALRYEELSLLEQASETLLLNRQGYIDTFSLTMPFKRAVSENSEPLPLDDDFIPDDDLLADYFDNQLNRFSDRSILNFIDSIMEGKDEITTTDIPIENADQLVMMILAIIKAVLGVIPYTVTKLSDRIDYANYYMPLYKFVRKK